MNTRRTVGTWLTAIAVAGVVAFAVTGLEGGVQTTGTIAGVVTMDDPPAPGTLAPNIDQTVCGDTLPNEEIVADADGHVANAVIRVTGVPWSEGPAASTLNNIDCRFVPHVQIAKTREQLDITSEDDTLHSTHAYDDRNRTDFNIAMPFSGLNVTRPLRRPGVMRVECDSHKWMRGWIVVSNDIGAVSEADGTFTIEDVPAGTHEVTIWHETLGSQPQTVTVTAGETTTAAFTLQ
jgi:plastocyanin